VAPPPVNNRPTRGDRSTPVTECFAGFSGDQLPLAALDPRQSETAVQVVLEHDVRDRAEHVDQLGDVDELAEPLDGLVGGVVDSQSIHARTALVASNAFPRSYEILSLAHLLH